MEMIRWEDHLLFVLVLALVSVMLTPACTSNPPSTRSISAQSSETTKRNAWKRMIGVADDPKDLLVDEDIDSARSLNDGIRLNVRFGNTFNKSKGKESQPFRRPTREDFLASLDRINQVVLKIETFSIARNIQKEKE